MKLVWRVVDSGKLHPEAVMAKDLSLLEQLDPHGVAIIHFYEWSVPCLTFGYFIDPVRHLDLSALKACGLHGAKRPTGGGIIFHQTDFAFSVLIPAHHPFFSQNTFENYAVINQWVAQRLVELFLLHEPPALLAPTHCARGVKSSFCMARPTPYDLVVTGKKVGGAAQRRTKNGLLHQATLSLCPPPFDILSQVIKDQEVVMSMRHNSHFLVSNESDLQAARHEIKAVLMREQAKDACEPPDGHGK